MRTVAKSTARSGTQSYRSNLLSPLAFLMLCITWANHSSVPCHVTSSPPIAAHLAQGQHHLGAGAREHRLGHEAAHVADEGGQEGHAGAALREGEQREGVHLENDE